MLLVSAYAGTGKTTTAIWGLGQKVPPGVKVSSEQKEIISTMRSFSRESCAAMAFNRSIADELKSRVPSGVEAGTANSFGFRAFTNAFGRPRKVDGNKNKEIYLSIAASCVKHNEIWKYLPDVCRLVGLCKGFLMEPEPENLAELAMLYDIDADMVVFDLVKKVFQAGLEMKDYIDYDDQMFMPIYLNLPIPQFDMVLVDELQDLNLAKQELAFRMARNSIVGIGDARQAIYGFSGADARAMDRMKERMSSADMKYPFSNLKLTITRRCPKVVVEFVNKYVPDFKAHDSAPDGEILHTPEGRFIEDMVDDKETGRMVLCRVNAPIMSLAFKLIAGNRRCYIQGKDIGEGLKREIKNTGSADISVAEKTALANIDKKIAKLREAKFPDDTKIEALEDRKSCISLLCVDVSNVGEFTAKVDALFKDKGNPSDIQLSTVHKAKGLEHPRVCIYKPSKLPLSIKKKGKGAAMQQEQEHNLAYVAYTRSQHTLEFVPEEK